VMSKPAVAGILALLISFLDAKSCELFQRSKALIQADDHAVVLHKHHWMLYWLVTAMYPQFLITLDEEELKEKAVTVRVGQAVNTVGLAGTRMGISGVSDLFGCLR